MGIGSSLQNAKNHEPPPLPPPFGPGGHIPRFSTISASSANLSICENDQRNRDSLKNEEWWQSRPSAPSLTSLSEPHETLLTYATQMTGWQSDYAPSAPSVRQEAMELTRTVSHLAAANQQLAVAHSALLAQLEQLYLELNKERDTKISTQCSGSQSNDHENLKRRIESIEDIIETRTCLVGGRGKNEDRKHTKKKEESENLRKEHQEAITRIQMLESELKVKDTRWKKHEEWNSEEDGDGDEKFTVKTHRLKRDNFELQEVNRKLEHELQGLRRDYEELSSKFQKKNDDANTRIMSLEEELKMAECARNETISHADDENSRLRKRLSEEMENKKKQGEAIQESLREIQRLTEALEAAKTRETKHIDVSDAETSMEEESNERPNLEEFKKDLCVKREARQRAIAAVSSEMDRLRRELDAEKEAHSETSKILDLLKVQAESASTKSETFSVGTTTNTTEEWKTPSALPDHTTSAQRDAQRLTDVLRVSDELRSCIRLQIEKIDDLRYHLECEPEQNTHRITTLKEVGNANKEAFGIREIQINQMKTVLSQLLARLGDDKFHIEVSDDLRAEQDRHVEDIRRLKSLYDERMRIFIDLKETASKELITTKDKLKCLTKDKEGLDEELQKAEEKIDVQDSEISNLESQLGLTKADCRDLQNQMSVINSLFSQMLLSASSADMDLDRLTELIQENHDLISDMAREEGTEAAALPKLLLDLVEQVEGREKSKPAEGTSEEKEGDSKEENIANNLPKVWRVLLELLSCHAVENTPTSPTSLDTDPNSCYKSVDTPTGPRLVISVSKTYIRLKELILEKKSLEKEMGRMKQLNSHLESKLGEQEKRLLTVSDELSKTWNVVGCMQAQHQQLHTHEKILRYELQQKRKMLQELKQELEYCREKWESARQKNTNTEMEWRNLRREFAARKALAAQDSFNTSGESGFSDERGDDSDDEGMPSEDRPRVGPRRRTKKESPRAPTSDTESEQPTDTEFSESKTESSSTPEQRTPTPEPPGINSDDIPGKELNNEQYSEPINPLNSLDQALANVIQNLIVIDTNPDEDSAAQSSVPTSSSLSEEHCKSKTGKEEIETNVTQENPHEETDHPHPENADTLFNKTEDVEMETSNSVSVFSIGPFPDSSNISLAKTVQFSDPLVVGPSTQSEKLLFESDLNVEMTEIISSPEEVNISSTESLVDSGESTDTQEEIKNADSVEIPVVPESSSPPVLRRTSEEVLAARDERLKRLEEQADWLMKKMNATNRRGSELSNRLEELHETYGEPPAPPPMPDVLPAVRLSTNEYSTQEEFEPRIESSVDEIQKDQL